MQISIQASTWEEVFKVFVTQIRGPRTAILSSNFDIQIFTTLFEVLMQPSFWLLVMTIDLFVDGVGISWQSFSQDSRGLCLFKISPGFCQEAAKRGATSTNHRDRDIV